MGYLHHDTATKTYFPTLRLTMLGAWLQQQYFQKSDLMGLLHAVAREAGGVAVLGMQSGIHVQYLMAVDAENKDIRAYWRIGSLRPICRSATGKMLLTLVTPQALKAIALHANSLEREASHRVKLKDLAQEIEVCRTLGYAISDGSVTPGRALVAVLLPTLPNHTPLALAVGGPVEHVKSQAKNWLEVLRRHVARYSAGDY
jgi:DNA-binding IclR family transcriptional regulator